MPAAQVCPDDRQFQSVISGHASENDASQFAAHIEVCPACAEQLDRSLAGDTLFEAMRGQATIVTSPGDAAAHALIERLLKLPRLASGAQSKKGAGTSPQDKPGAAASRSLGASPLSRLPADAGTNVTQYLGKSGALGEEPAGYDFLSPPERPDEIGRLGPYRILKVLGAGGMGVVFQAEDLQLQRIVALKVMKPAASVQPGAKERFLREAQAAAKVEHENIVTIHQVGEIGGVPFLAMQWLKGHSLDEYIKRPGPLKLVQVLRVGRQIALGLAAAHEHGLIHRDIKPANIWIESVGGGRVRILDFGLARPIVDDMHLTQSGSIMGTPAYMAPEQSHGAKVDHRCDLFSLGVVLYRMTTGQLPFTGDTAIAILVSLAVSTPASPQSLGIELPADFSELIMQLLEKEPAGRPASAREVVDRLQRIGQQLAATAKSGEVATSAIVERSLQPAAKLAERPAAAAKGNALPATLPGRRIPRWRTALLGGGLAAAAVFAAVFFLQTDKGVVRVEINDPSIEAVLSGSGAVIKGPAAGQEFKLAIGEHGLRVSRDGLEFDTEKFELKHGDTVTLKVELLPGKIQVSQDGRLIGSQTIPAAAGTTAVADKGSAGFENLAATSIPEADRFDWQPKELVSVIGEHRGRPWGRVFGVLWSAVGDFLITKGDTTMFWDAETLRPRAWLPHDAGSIALAPDGATLAIRAWGEVGQELHIWKLVDGVPKQRTVMPQPPPRSLCWAADGTTLAVGYDDTTIRLWNVPERKLITQIKGHSSPVNDVAFAPDGKMLVSAGDQDGLRVWDLSGAEPKEQTPQPVDKGSISKLIFAANGKVLCDCSDRKTRLWDVDGLKLTPRADQIPAGSNMRISLSPDGQTLASDFNDGTHLYDLTASPPHLEAKLVASADSESAFAPNGKQLATANSQHGMMRMWDLTGSPPEERFKPQLPLGPMTGVVVSPDGKSLVTFSGWTNAALLWDMTGAAPRLRGELGGLEGGVRSVAFTPDSTRAVVGGHGSRLQLWNVTTDEPELVDSFAGDGRAYVGLAFLKDGTTLLAGGAIGDKWVPQLWDLTAGKLRLRTTLDGATYPFVITPDGKTLIAECPTTTPENPKNVQHWDLSGPEPKKSPEPFGFRTGPMALSDDGKTLAFYNWFTGSIYLWKIGGEQPEELTSIGITNPNAQMPALALSSDGKWLTAYTDYDGLVVWKVSTGERRHKWQFPGRVDSATFSPDGQHLIAGNDNGTAYVLKLTPAAKKP